MPKGSDEPAANSNVLNGHSVSSVSYDETSRFTKDGESWIEDTKDGTALRMHEVSTEECCVHLRDDMRGMNILLDLTLGRITWQGDDGKKYYVTIQGFQ